MKILDPVLVPDVSEWCNHIKAKEFEAGGCASVVVGLYPITVGGKWVLNPICRAQCVEVASNSKMVLQAYYWDDITLDPIKQADWVCETILKEGLPIKFVWADLEQWWTNWVAWANARECKIPWNQVPAASGQAISSHMGTFCGELKKGFPASGVYTNNGFVSSWARGMNAWLPSYKQWVAQYGHEPARGTAMSWAELQRNWLPEYEITLASGQLPEMVMGHQFTGDVCELPGSYDQYSRELTLDVSVFSKAFIESLRGGPNPPAPTTSAPVVASPAPTNTEMYKVTKTCWICATANDGVGCKLVEAANPGMAVTVTLIQGDWAQISAPVAGWMRMVNLKVVP
jgi:hypothetical protein